jgi:hypothetical protein
VEQEQAGEDPCLDEGAFAVLPRYETRDLGRRPLATGTLVERMLEHVLLPRVQAQTARLSKVNDIVARRVDPVRVATNSRGLRAASRV